MASLVDAVSDSVVRSVVRQQRFRPQNNLVPGANQCGGALKKARKGAKGIAGVRADLLDGTYTIRSFALLSLREISKRYRVSYPATARYLRDSVALGRL